jgi:GTPase SAR1 family protein
MAGSGKTTLIQRINSHLHASKRQGYIINLDPAVSHLPYGANVDIRDTVRLMFVPSTSPSVNILACGRSSTRML